MGYYNSTRQELGTAASKMFGRPRNTNNLYKSIGKKVDDNRVLYPAPPTLDRGFLYCDGVDKSPGRYKDRPLQRAKSVEPFSENMAQENKSIQNNNQDDTNLQDIDVQGNTKLQNLKPKKTQDKFLTG